MVTSFLDTARLGKNEWWRYVLGVLVVFFMAAFVGAIPLLVAVAVVLGDRNPNTDVNPVTGMLVGVDPLLSFPLLMCSFVAWFLGLVLVVRFLHRRPAVTLVTPGRPIRWRRIAQGLALWVLLISVVSVVETLLFPGRYVLTFDPVRFFPFALMAFALVPIQAASEELFFRGYLMPGLGLLTRNPVVLSVVTALLFALPHFLNPEVTVNFWLVMSYYFLFGLGMALVTLRDNSLELAIGAHVGNNLFSALLANFEGSALETPSIFTASSFDPLFNLVATLLVLVAFYLLLFRLWPAEPNLAVPAESPSQD